MQDLAEWTAQRPVIVEQVSCGRLQTTHLHACCRRYSPDYLYLVQALNRLEYCLKSCCDSLDQKILSLLNRMRHLTYDLWARQFLDLTTDVRLQCRLRTAVSTDAFNESWYLEVHKFLSIIWPKGPWASTFEKMRICLLIYDKPGSAAVGRFVL